MSTQLSRRKLITTGLAAAAGVAGLAAAERVANRYGLIPPDDGGVWGPGETLTYAAQRMLMAHHSMAREFGRSEISKGHPRQRRSTQGWTLRGDAVERIQGLAFADRRHGGSPGFVLDGRSEAPARARPDHAPGLRRGLVVHRRVAWRSAFGCLESGRRQRESQIRCGLRLRRRVGLARPARCLSSADLPDLRVERQRNLRSVMALRYVCASRGSWATRA